MDGPGRSVEGVLRAVGAGSGGLWLWPSLVIVDALALVLCGALWEVDDPGTSVPAWGMMMWFGLLRGSA